LDRQNPCGTVTLGGEKNIAYRYTLTTHGDSSMNTGKNPSESGARRENKAICPKKSQ